MLQPAANLYTTCINGVVVSYCCSICSACNPLTNPHSTIPPEDLQELSELFTSIDEEGTGTITYDQLRSSLDMAGCQVGSMHA